MPLRNIRAKHAGGVMSNSLRAEAAGMAGVSIASVGAALLIGLISLPKANAQTISDTMPLSYSATELFAKTLRDQTAAVDDTIWSDFSALGYAKSSRAAPAAVQWLPQSMPAVDGFNAKIDGYGGGANHISSLYGTNGSLAFPIAQQWGAQIDGGVGSFNRSGTARGAGHVFWRDPSIGLLGAYGSYSHWNGIGFANISHIGTSVSRAAAEGEYYAGRWTFGGLAGYETGRVNAPVVAGLTPFSIPNRFFDSVRASYYVTDNFKLSLGHVYTIGRHALSLGSEYGFALGGGRMASVFVQGVIGEGGNNAVAGGLRIYFGQRDKTLIDRNRQDDPLNDQGLQFMEDATVNEGLNTMFLGDFRLFAELISPGPISPGFIEVFHPPGVTPPSQTTP